MTDQPLNLDTIQTRIADSRAALTQWIDRYSPQPGQDALERVEGVLKEDAPRLAAEVRRLRAELTTATEFRLTPAPPAYTPLIVRRDRAYDGTRWAVLHDPSDLSVRRAWTADGWEMTWALRHAEIFCWPDAETALAQARQAQAEDDREPDVDGVGRTPESYRDRPAAVPAAGETGE